MYYTTDNASSYIPTSSTYPLSRPYNEQYIHSEESPQHKRREQDAIVCPEQRTTASRSEQYRSLSRPILVRRQTYIGSLVDQ